MGIQPGVAAFVSRLPLPQPFSVCELGDQGMCGEGKNIPAQPWYESLGCRHYVSIDGNGRGTLTADLNQPLTLQAPSLLLSDGFDLVTDFGTGEHIFDQAQVWRTMHRLTKPGGMIAFDRPSAGYTKHCFYVTHECLYRDLAAANEYTVVWLEEADTPRGTLIRGVFRTPRTSTPFRVPQQGRYRESLVIPT